MAKISERNVCHYSNINLGTNKIFTRFVAKSNNLTHLSTFVRLLCFVIETFVVPQKIRRYYVASSWNNRFTAKTSITERHFCYEESFSRISSSPYNAQNVFHFNKNSLFVWKQTFFSLIKFFVWSYFFPLKFKSRAAYEMALVAHAWFWDLVKS